MFIFVKKIQLMKKEYFISINGESQGPYQFSELGQFIISPTTLIWHSELHDWTEARFLREFEVYLQRPMYSTPNYGYNQNVSLAYTRDNRYVIVTTPTERIHYRYADFGERFVAGLLDGLILLIPSLFFPFIAGWLYYSLMQSNDGQATIGQKTMKIMLLDCKGQRVTFGQATGRFFARLLSGFIFCIGYFMFFWSDQKQTLHDNLAETLVVTEIRRERL